ncbi:MAG TPA: cupin domain-containing protein [Terriglobales bacterium]|nr:cupin domain-containing protein [Terriglobales bacterium]
MNSLSSADVIRLLDLKPLTIEGGLFRETYRSPQSISLPLYSGPRSLATAIYYLLTPDTFSRMHRVPGEEIFHFYLGDPVEMLQLNPGGSGEIITMGHDIASGMKLQHVVPGGWWQGARLKAGGRFALMGTTMSPGFEYEDYAMPKGEELIAKYRDFAAIIFALTPEH